MTVVGFDLDGCAHNFTRRYLRIINREFDVEIPKDYEVKHWDFYEDFGFTVQEFIAQLENWQDEMFGPTPGFADIPEPGFTNVVRKLRNEWDCHVHIITHRNTSRAIPLTVAWLDEWGIKHDGIHFVADKTLVNVDLLVDDAPPNVLAAEKAGQPIMIYDQPYNRHLDGPRAFDWDDVYWYIVENLMKENSE